MNSHSGGRHGRNAKQLQALNPQPHHESSAQAAAANSLQLLLREDQLLMQYGLTESRANPDQVAFPYAAALLQLDEDGEQSNGNTDKGSSTKDRADACLQEVEQRLALVESLAVKLSRTRPEAVAGHLLRLHGYELDGTTEQEGEAAAAPAATAVTSTTTGSTTLSSIRDRADRLERQADVLESVASRVDCSLTRGLSRMEASCTKLERVLKLSNTLKSILRLQFETNKLMNYDLEDQRDLTRAAASVSVLEELLSQAELQQGIDVVEKMRPEIQSTAKQVRESAARLLQEQTFTKTTALPKLGSIFQVYFHLGELPSAVWNAVNQAHAKAESLSRELFNPVTLVNLAEQAKRTAKESRLIQKKLRQIRAEAAQEWIQGMTEIALQVRNMQRVLARKTDPVSRQLFVDVVNTAPTPPAYAEYVSRDINSIFALFWARLCSSLSSILGHILLQDGGKYAPDVAALYPPVRAAGLELINRLQESLPSSILDEAGTTSFAGILGGTATMDDNFLEWNSGQSAANEVIGDNPQAAPDQWSRQTDSNHAAAKASSQTYTTGLSSSSLSTVMNSFEWRALQGSTKSPTGLFGLQQAFVEACTDRLCAPLKYMFPENIQVDDDGVAINAGFHLLPSKYDVQRFDENIRQELAFADPREGGGDLTLVTMVSDCVVTMTSRFCELAKNALSGASSQRDGYIGEHWSMSDSLQHDRKVIAIVYTLAKYLRQAPDKTFIAPYRPTVSSKHEEAANLCKAGLVPGLHAIEKMVKSTVLNPVIRALNRRIANVLARIHQGVYIDSPTTTDGEFPAFVQKHFPDIFETIATSILSKFPPEYASYMASAIASYTIYCFISNSMLIRPFGETARLHITQDVSDLELILEQFVVKYGGSLTLHDVGDGRPYAELRAVRQMLFWTGLEDMSKSSQEISKLLLREPWMKVVRPSTILHYLFSSAPKLLSSPHHMKRVKAEDYAMSLLSTDGASSEGEDAAWINVLTCCDAYQQRVSSQSAAGEGDARIPHVLMLLGPELLRRRQRN
ncbi:hypothetical protein MPSEU_000259300 [Mayamaea pseudoterrestris]|nr:hypothetical protein MPSEU_000259300 [Mayamaea pseudoterrestris]